MLSTWLFNRNVEKTYKKLQELHGASAVEEKIAELNQSGQLGAPNLPRICRALFVVVMIDNLSVWG